MPCKLFPVTAGGLPFVSFGSVGFDDELSEDGDCVLSNLWPVTQIGFGSGFGSDLCPVIHAGINLGLLDGVEFDGNLYPFVRIRSGFIFLVVGKEALADDNAGDRFEVFGRSFSGGGVSSSVNPITEMEFKSGLFDRAFTRVAITITAIKTIGIASNLLAYEKLVFPDDSIMANLRFKDELKKGCEGDGCEGER